MLATIDRQRCAVTFFLILDCLLKQSKALWVIRYLELVEEITHDFTSRLLTETNDNSLMK